MKFIIFFLLFSFPFSLWAETSYVPPTKILSKGGYQLGLSGDYFSTSTRVDSDKREWSFEDGESFKRIQSSFHGLYGLTENLQLGLGARLRHNRSVLFNNTTGENDSENSTGLESTFVSALFSMKPLNRLQYSLGGIYRHRPYTNEENGDLILGDEGRDYLIQMSGTYAFQGANFLSGSFGYRKPGTHLSSELNWQVEGALVWNAFSLLGGVEGITSLNNDPYEDDELSRPFYNTGSTLLYSSKNREIIAPYLGVNIAFHKHWRIEVKASEVVTAQSSDKGRTLEVSLFKRVDAPKASQSVDKKFKEYDFEATITKVSPKKTLISLDKGITTDLKKGMKVDIFEFDYVGGNLLIASGVVIEVTAETSLVKITHLYNSKKELKEGLVARGSYK